MFSEPRRVEQPNGTISAIDINTYKVVRNRLLLGPATLSISPINWLEMLSIRLLSHLSSLHEASVAPQEAITRVRNTNVATRASLVKPHRSRFALLTQPFTILYFTYPHGSTDVVSVLPARRLSLSVRPSIIRFLAPVHMSQLSRPDDSLLGNVQHNTTSGSFLITLRSIEVCNTSKRGI